MGKLLLMVLLALVSNSVMAEWFIVGESSGKQGAIDFIDPASVRWSDDKATLWRLDDFKSAQTDASGTYLSLKSQSEYYCKDDEPKIRSLASSEYSGNMATGDLLHSEDTPGSWSPVIPGSLDQTLWNKACQLGRGLRPY